MFLASRCVSLETATAGGASCRLALQASPPSHPQREVSGPGAKERDHVSAADHPAPDEEERNGLSAGERRRCVVRRRRGSRRLARRVLHLISQLEMRNEPAAESDVKSQIAWPGTRDLWTACFA